MPPSCIHVACGLCPKCQAEYDEDPGAWLEFGDHPEGIRRWRELQEEIARDAAAAAAERLAAATRPDDNEIPF